MKRAIILISIFLNISFLWSDELKTGDFPFELSEFKEAFTFSAGLGLMTSFLFTPSTDHDSEDILALSRYDINLMDRPAIDLNDKGSDIASDVLVYSLAASPLLLFADRRLNKNFRNSVTYLVMYAESALIANGISRTLKTIFKRTRPYTYNDSLTLKKRTDDDWNLSFPSNHTVNGFNAAVFISTVFTMANPDSKWIPAVWTISLSAAITTGVLRVTAGKHFPTDVIAGAVLGSLTGALIPLLHKKKKKDLSVIPVFSDEYAGIDLTMIY